MADGQFGVAALVALELLAQLAPVPLPRPTPLGEVIAEVAVLAWVRPARPILLNGYALEQPTCDYECVSQHFSFSFLLETSSIPPGQRNPRASSLWKIGTAPTWGKSILRTLVLLGRCTT